MPTTNDIVLRPRFKFDVNTDNMTLLELFEASKKDQKKFIISRIDDHVFIKIPKSQQHFWSPQLHIEIIKNENDNTKSTIYGLFGPNPTVWTMFMFFHFIIASLFVGFGIWAYSNWSLDTGFSMQLFVVLLMIVFWFALYFAGRVGKQTGKAQMHALHQFMRDTLGGKDINSTDDSI